MKIKELNGKAVKEELGCSRSRYRYHNKNIKGGNFCFEIKDGMGHINIDISGDYDASGLCRNITINENYHNGTIVKLDGTFIEIMDAAREYIKMLRKELEK